MVSASHPHTVPRGCWLPASTLLEPSLLVSLLTCPVGQFDRQSSIIRATLLISAFLKFCVMVLYGRGEKKVLCSNMLICFVHSKKRVE